MSFNNGEFEFLKSNQTLLAKRLLERLSLEKWPIKLDQLPSDSLLVGGAVRDGLLGRLKERPDLDFILRNNAIEFTHKLAKEVNGKCIVLDYERKIVRLSVKGWTLDFATLVGENLEDDLLRRDFKINSIALKLGLKPDLVDPNQGIKDLEKGVISAITEKNLIEDPLRLMRGFRLMCELNFSLDRKTIHLINKHSKLIHNVATERVKTEILKIVRSKWPKDFLYLFIESGLLKGWTDGKNINFLIQNDIKDMFDNELLIARTFSRLLLLSDEGLELLRFSKSEIRKCAKLRLWIKRLTCCGFETLSEDDLFALHVECEYLLPALIIFLPASHRAEWLKRWRDPSDPLFHPECPLNGFELQEGLSVPPGPVLGAMMRYLSKENAFGRLQTKKQAFDLAFNFRQQNLPFM